MEHEHSGPLLDCSEEPPKKKGNDLSTSEIRNNIRKPVDLAKRRKRQLPKRKPKSIGPLTRSTVKYSSTVSSEHGNTSAELYSEPSSDDEMDRNTQNSPTLPPHHNPDSSEQTQARMNVSPDGLIDTNGEVTPQNGATASAPTAPGQSMDVPKGADYQAFLESVQGVMDRSMKRAVEQMTTNSDASMERQLQPITVKLTEQNRIILELIHKNHNLSTRLESVEKSLAECQSNMVNPNLEARLTALEKSVDAITKPSARADTNVVHPDQSHAAPHVPTEPQLPMGTPSREELMLEMQKNAEVVILGASILGSLQPGYLGSQTQHFTFRADRCWTLKQVPASVAKLIPSGMKPKAIVLDGSVNTVQQIGSMPVPKEQKIQIYQQQVTEAVHATKTALPGTEILFVKPNPLYNPGIPDTRRPDCDFLDDAQIQYGEGTHVVDPDYLSLAGISGKFRDNSVIDGDGRHLGRLGMEHLTQAVGKGIVRAIGIGSGSVASAMFPTIRNLRTVREFTNARNAAARQGNRGGGNILTRFPREVRPQTQHQQFTGLDLGETANVLFDMARSMQSSAEFHNNLRPVGPPQNSRPAGWGGSWGGGYGPGSGNNQPY